MPKGSLELTTGKPSVAFLPLIRPMNSSLERAYGYVEEARIALGKKRRQRAAMTIESGGVFVAELAILTLLFLGAIRFTGQNLMRWPKQSRDTVFCDRGKRITDERA